MISRVVTLPMVMVLFALVAGIYSVVVPPYEAPDEIWHMAFIHHLVTEREMPVSEPNTTALFRQQGTQSPGYYIAAALLTSWIDQSDFPARYAQTHPHAAIGQPERLYRNYFLHDSSESFPWQGAILALHLTRFFSIGLGMVTLWSVYQTIRTITGDSDHAKRTALLGTALLAFIPQFVFISAMANNDNAINATAALLIWRLTVALKGAQTRQLPTLRDVAGIGLWVGLGVLSKASGLWLIVVALVVLGIVAYRAGAGWWWLRNAGLVLGITVLLSGWWFVHNYQLYGDPSASNIWFSNILLRNRPATWRTLVYSEWESLEHSFWGLFGWFNVAYPTWLYRGFQLVELLILSGLGIWLWRTIRRGAFQTTPFGPKAGTLLLVIWLLCLTISWAGFFRVAPAAQGRYFFPASATLALGMGIGLGAWRPTAHAPRLLAWGLAGGLFGLSLITPFWLIYPAYTPAPVLAELPATATPLDLTFGDTMHLVGYEVTPTTLAPSTPIDLTLYWRALRPIEANYSISIKGFGQALRHDTVAEDNSYPDAGRRATSDWTTEGIIVDRWRIWMSGESVPPTLARLTVELFLRDEATGAPGEPLPITMAGMPVASPYYFGEVVVRDEPRTIPPADFTFRPIEPALTLTDTTATLNFVWEVGNTLPQNYQMLVHLVEDPAQPPLATGDAPPVEGNFPTTYWQAGDRILQTATLTLPSDLPPGTYLIYVGLYDLATGERVVGEGDTREWNIATVAWDGERWRDETP